MSKKSPEEIRRIQELRRSSAASPRETSKTRAEEERMAIQEQFESKAHLYGRQVAMDEMANQPGWNDADPMVMDVPKDPEEED